MLLDIFEDLFDNLSGCAMIAIIGGIVLVLVICVVIAVAGFGIASWI